MLSLSLAMIAAQAAPAALQPEGPWQLDSLEAGCRITRSYAGEIRAEFGFERSVTSPGTILLLSAPKAMLPEGTGSIRLSVFGRAAQVHYGTFAVAEPGMRLVKLFPDSETITALAAADSLELGAHSVRIAGKGIEPALKALDDCTAKLLASWGADAGLYRAGKLATPAGSPGGWFTSDDYRRVMGSGTGTARFVLLITTGPNGKAARCKPVASSDHGLDEAICGIALRRSRFTAPLGTDGKPIASYAVLPVHWGSQ